MAFNDETVKAKLSQLNETQDSIMAVSQWIQFHRRQASRTAHIWARQIQTSFPPKRLPLIYLANDVVQQTKNRGKDDFYKAFSPVMTDAFSESYTSANSETRGKLRRVLDVWRQRNIFDPDVQNAMEKKVNDVDKGRGAKGKLGGSLFASGSASSTGTPSELKDLANLQTNLSKAAAASASASQTAATEYNTLTAPNYATPTPPVHAARLNQLLKSLSTAHSSLNTTLAARDALIENLTKTLEEHRTAREKEAMEMRDLEKKRPEIEERKSKVEDAIMRGLSAEEAAAATAEIGANGGTGDEPEIPRPDFEELTPPPEDVVGTIEADEDDGARTPTEEVPPSILAAQQQQSIATHEPPAAAPQDPRRRPKPQAGVAAPNTGIKRPSEDDAVAAPAVPVTHDPRRKSFENHTFKRRKTEEEHIGGDGGLEGLDDDVVGALG